MIMYLQSTIGDKPLVCRLGHPDLAAQWLGRVSGFLCSRSRSDGQPQCGQPWPGEAHWSMRFDIRLFSLMLCSCTPYAVPRFLRKHLNISVVATSPEKRYLRLHSLVVAQRRSAPLFITFDVSRGIVHVMSSSPVQTSFSCSQSCGFSLVSVPMSTHRPS
jgi:hypothetical protein